MKHTPIAIQARLALLGGLLLAGCAAVQPPGEAVPMSLDEARARTEAVTVRWGGTIVDVVNGQAGTTLQVVARPLDRAGRPVRNDTSEGRFLADYAGFLDPEIYVAGRDVTVLGALAGTREGRIGDTDYAFPVVTVDALRYWQPRVNPPYPPGFYSYHDWWWHRFEHDWPYAPPPRSFVRGEVVF